MISHFLTKCASIEALTQTNSTGENQKNMFNQKHNKYQTETSDGDDDEDEKGGNCHFRIRFHSNKFETLKTRPNLQMATND